jgi:hypothetical protein
MEESDGVSSTQTAVGSDTAEDTENTTVLVQMEEEKRATMEEEKCVIRGYSHETWSSLTLRVW